MTCEAAREAIQESLDGAIAPAAQAALTSHLAGCEACRTVQAGLRLTVESLSRAAAHDRAVTAPVALLDRLGLASPAPVVAFKPRRRWLPAGMVAAAVVLVAGLAVTLSRPAPESPMASLPADEAVAVTDAEWIHAWMGAEDLGDPLAY